MESTKTTHQEQDQVKERILDLAAKRNMLQWELKGFKRSFPRLYRTIMEAMDDYKSLT